MPAARQERSTREIVVRCRALVFLTSIGAAPTGERSRARPRGRNGDGRQAILWVISRGPGAATLEGFRGGLPLLAAAPGVRARPGHGADRPGGGTGRRSRGGAAERGAGGAFRRA